MAWPRDNQASLIAFYGNPGSALMEKNLVKVIPPFRMTYAGKPVPHLMFHKLAAPALQRALNTVWEYYDKDQKKIDALGISKTAGTYNPRKIRGSATKWSNHAYGAAIDINAEQNGFNVAGNIPLPMIAAFKAEGARWGGDYTGRKDPMHFEFCESGEPVRTFKQWLQHYGVTATKPAATPSPVQSKPIVKNNFNDCFRRLLVHEGGYGNHPSDPGGPTNFGITLTDYRKYIKASGTAADVQRMTADQAKIIYKSKYWDAMNCDALPAGLDYAMFDYGVNSGIGRAPKILQRLAGVPQDGDIGSATLSAISTKDTRALINALCDERMTYLKSLPIWPTFKTGWTRRVSEVRAAALVMAGKPKSNAVPAVVVTSIIVAGGGAVAHEASKTDSNWGSIAFIAGAVLIVAVIAFVIIRSMRKQ